MASLRPARTIRDPDKVPWTRYSRKREKNYVKAMPHKDLHHLITGTKNDNYNVEIHLVAKNTYYHRDNALEAARKTANNYLEKNINGKYLLIIRKYPHHIIRENRMVAGAGADRIQQGMRHAFGKPVDRAALIREGDEVITVYTYKEYVDVVKEALRRASRKLSGSFKVVIKEGGGVAS